MGPLYSTCRDMIINIGLKITYTFCEAAGLEMYIPKYYFSKIWIQLEGHNPLNIR